MVWHFVRSWNFRFSCIIWTLSPFLFSWLKIFYYRQAYSKYRRHKVARLKITKLYLSKMYIKFSCQFQRFFVFSLSKLVFSVCHNCLYLGKTKNHKSEEHIIPYLRANLVASTLTANYFGFSLSIKCNTFEFQ